MSKKNAPRRAEKTAETAKSGTDYDLLSVQLFRIFRAAASMANAEFKKLEWNINPAEADGWLAVGRHIFYNYELKSNAGWKSVSVELPDDETTVLIHVPEDDSEKVWFAFKVGDEWRTAEEGHVIECPVTHWMHLPEPPSIVNRQSQIVNEKGPS